MIDIYPYLSIAAIAISIFSALWTYRMYRLQRYANVLRRHSNRLSAIFEKWLKEQEKWLKERANECISPHYSMSSLPDEALEGLRNILSRISGGPPATDLKSLRVRASV